MGILVVYIAFPSCLLTNDMEPFCVHIAYSYSYMSDLPIVRVYCLYFSKVASTSDVEYKESSYQGFFTSVTVFKTYKSVWFLFCPDFCCYYHRIKSLSRDWQGVSGGKSSSINIWVWFSVLTCGRKERIDPPKLSSDLHMSTMSYMYAHI